MDHDALSLLLEDVDSLQLNIESNLSQLQKSVHTGDRDTPSAIGDSEVGNIDIEQQISVHLDDRDAPSAIGDSEIESEIGAQILVETDPDFVHTPRTASVDFRGDVDEVISRNEIDLEGELI